MIFFLSKLIISNYRSQAINKICIVALFFSFFKIYAEESSKKEPKFIKFLSKYSIDIMYGEGNAIGMYKNRINNNSEALSGTLFYDSMTNDERSFGYYTASKDSKLISTNNHISIRFYDKYFHGGFMLNPKLLRVTQAYPSENMLSIPSGIKFSQSVIQNRPSGSGDNLTALKYLYYYREDKMIPIWDLYWLIGFEKDFYYVKPYITFGIPGSFFPLLNGYFHLMSGIRIKVFDTIHINFEGYHMRYEIPEYKKVEYKTAGDIPNVFDSGVRFGISFINDPD